MAVAAAVAGWAAPAAPAAAAGPAGYLTGGGGAGGIFTGGGGGSFGVGTGSGGGAITAGGGAASGCGVAGNEPDGAVGRETAPQRDAATACRSVECRARTAIVRRTRCAPFFCTGARCTTAAGFGATNAAGVRRCGARTALTPA